MSFTYDATDVFDPVDGGGSPRGASMSEARTWSTEMQTYVEGLLTDVAALEAIFTGKFVLSGVVSPAQITANQNDYNPTGWSAGTILSINSDAARSITGLAGGETGRFAIIYNSGSQTITLEHEDSGSVAANRFWAHTGVDKLISPGVAATFIYLASRWREIT